MGLMQGWRRQARAGGEAALRWPTRLLLPPSSEPPPAGESPYMAPNFDNRFDTLSAVRRMAAHCAFHDAQRCDAARRHGNPLAREASVLKQLSRLMLILVCLAWTSVAHAQIRSATLTGTVTDPQKAIVPGATVVVTNEGTNVSQELVTNDAGLFTAPCCRRAPTPSP